MIIILKHWAVSHIHTITHTHMLTQGAYVVFSHFLFPKKMFSCSFVCHLFYLIEVCSSSRFGSDRAKLISYNKKKNNFALFQPPSTASSICGFHWKFPSRLIEHISVCYHQNKNTKKKIIIRSSLKKKKMGKS